MLLERLVEASARVAGTRSRTAKVAELASVLTEAAPDEIETVVGLLAGEPRQGRIGVGWASVASVETVPSPEASITVGEVDALLDALAGMTGAGSQGARRDALTALFERATEREQEFLTAALTGGVRQGALEGLMAEAVAVAAAVRPDQVRRALMLGGSLPATAVLALAGGAEALASVHLEVLRPIRPMLAATATDAAAAVAELGEVIVDWKLDGARIQVHRAGQVVRVFTRNLNDVTERLPEVVSLVGGLPVASVVLDGESLALDEDGAPRTFATTMSRFGADDADGAVALLPFFFDILHLDGEDLVDLPLVDRLAMLDRIVPAAHRIPRRHVTTPEAADAVLDAAVTAGHEGVMLKGVDSVYEAGRRGSAWRKVKPVHTLDLVVLAAEWGHGRRTGWLSNLHLGCRDPETGDFVMLGKTFKGLTDAMLEWQTERLLELEERRTAHTVFVRPELVVEVALDGLVASPRYPAGMALRFARVRAHRPDKDASEVDSLDIVRSLYERRS